MKVYYIIFVLMTICLRKANAVCSCSSGTNQIATNCATPPECQITCANWAHPPPNCVSTKCKKGCNCLAGYVRSGHNCVLIEDCPRPPKCEKNETYSKSGLNCRTCENKNDDDCICPEIIPHAGCFCQDGYFFDNFTGDCILPEDCPPSKCGKKQVYVQCISSACPVTCDNWATHPGHPCIPFACESGCECLPGYILNGKDCVRKEQCPGPPICNANETFRQSCLNCRTCENPYFDNCPEIMPYAGCFCSKGYVLENTQCVLPDDCVIDCGQYAEYKKCGPACQKTCNDKYTDVMTNCASKMCVPGCFCLQGYIYDSVVGYCVPEGHCSNQCGENEIWSMCGASCQPNCYDIIYEPQICNRMCIPGCVCEEGYVRDTFGQKCIPKEDCCCGPNEVYSQCVTTCPITCQGMYRGGSYCNPFCKEGCACKAGYIRNEYTGYCVAVADCPPYQSCN